MSVLYNEAENINFRDNGYPQIHDVKQAILAALEGGGGTSDYEDLENLPTINGAEVKGELSSEDLKLSEVKVIPADAPMTLTGLQDLFLADESIKMVYIPEMTFTFDGNDKLLWGGFEVSTGETPSLTGALGAAATPAKDAINAIRYTVKKTTIDGVDYYPEIKFIGCMCRRDDSESSTYDFKRIRIKAEKIFVITRKVVSGSNKNLGLLEMCSEDASHQYSAEMNVGTGFIPFTFQQTNSDNLSYDVSATYRTAKEGGAVTRMITPSGWTRNDPNLRDFLQSDSRILEEGLRNTADEGKYRYEGMLVRDITNGNLWNITESAWESSAITFSLEKINFAGSMIVYR